jgi:hypothetical protein
MKRIPSLLAAAVLALAPAAGAADNIVVATNSRDGSSVYRVSLKLVRVGGDTVDTGNAAVAVSADCTDCQTVAIALEGVLVDGSPSVFTPTNLAIAINVDCDDCNTLAAAYQDVLQTNGHVHFTADGNYELAQIRRQLEALRRSDLSIWDLQAAADALANELADVLNTQVVYPHA